MKFLPIILLSLAFALPAYSQWIRQTVDTTASFRGLAVVDANVVWASGTGGTVIRTADGGTTWDVVKVPGGEKLDFRDIEAFDAKTVYILSIGNGGDSRIYKTADGGKTWSLQFTNTDEKAFFDSIACWDRANCIAMSDPVDGKYVLIRTTDGKNWTHIDTAKMPAAGDGEAAFAASGTCVITSGKNTAFLITGGTDARVFRSDDRGESWKAFETPIISGTSGSGIFSIAMRNKKNGIIVGGDYERPHMTENVAAFTNDGGKTWKSVLGLTGYRSAVAFIDRKTVIAVGINGTDISSDGGRTWKNIGSEELNAVQARDQRSIWAVGPRGSVNKLSVPK